MGPIALFRTATPRLRMLTSTQHMSDHKNKLYYGDNLEVLRDYIPDQSANLIYLDPPFNSRQIHDYHLSASDTARIQCTAPSLDGNPLSRCPSQATHGQNAGSAPFWYHCDSHAALWRNSKKSFGL